MKHAPVAMISCAISIWILVQAYVALVGVSRSHAFRPDLEGVLYRVEQRLDALEKR